jgi:maleate cis-trans isomerase
MIGWRGHLGYIAPAIQAGRMVREFYDVVPEGVDISFATLTVHKIARDEMDGLKQPMLDAARLLALRQVDAIYLAGLPPIVIGKPGYDRELVAAMEDLTERPCCTAATGVMEACSALGIRRLVMAAPFEEWVINAIKSYYAAAGLDIVHMKGMPLVTGTERFALPLDLEYTFTRQVFRECAEDVDGIYIPCGGWGTAHNIERLEQDLGKPVVTWFNNMIWWFLSNRGVKAPIRGFGSLLASLGAG